MKYLVRQLASVSPTLAKEVEQLFMLPNYKLQLSSEPFGLKVWPKGLYAMHVNSAKLDKLLAEHLEDEEEVFEKRHPLPANWDVYQVLAVIASLTEFHPLTLQKVGNTPRNLARALMQIIEASDSTETHIGRESGFPQTLRSFEALAEWCLKNHLVALNTTRPIKKVAPGGAFHLGSVERLIKDYGTRK